MIFTTTLSSSDLFTHESDAIQYLDQSLNLISVFAELLQVYRYSLCAHFHKAQCVRVGTKPNFALRPAGCLRRVILLYCPSRFLISVRHFKKMSTERNRSKLQPYHGAINYSTNKICDSFSHRTYKFTKFYMVLSTLPLAPQFLKFSDSVHQAHILIIISPS